MKTGNVCFCFVLNPSPPINFQKRKEREKRENERGRKRNIKRSRQTAREVFQESRVGVENLAGDEDRCAG